MDCLQLYILFYNLTLHCLKNCYVKLMKPNEFRFFLLRSLGLPGLFIIIKTSSTDPSGKNKVVYKLLSQPHKHLRHGKLKKAQLREATNGWLHPWTAPVPVFDCTRSGVKHSVGKVIPQSNQSRQERPSILGRSTPSYFNSSGWAAAAARVCRTLVEADGSSQNRQWLEFELTLYNIQSIDDTTTRNSDRDKARPPNTPAHKKLEVTFSSWPPHRRTILKDWENKWKIAKKYHRGNTNIRFNSLKIPILWETRETIPRTLSSKVSLLSNFTPKMSRLGLARKETPDKTKSPWRGLTVLDLLTTKALVFLGFSIMHQWLHHFWFLAKSMLRRAATAGLSAGLRTTASSVESSA